MRLAPMSTIVSRTRSSPARATWYVFDCLSPRNQLDQKPVRIANENPDGGAELHGLPTPGNYGTPAGFHRFQRGVNVFHHYRNRGRSDVGNSQTERRSLDALEFEQLPIDGRAGDLRGTDAPLRAHGIDQRRDGLVGCEFGCGRLSFKTQ